MSYWTKIISWVEIRMSDQLACFWGRTSQNPFLNCSAFSKNKLHTSNIDWHRICITIPKGKNGDIVRKYWIKARTNWTETQQSKLKPCNFVFDVKGPACLCPSFFAAWHPSLSWAGYIHYLQFSLAVSWFWFLQHLGVSNALLSSGC